jgi:hypothetical protein
MKFPYVAFAIFVSLLASMSAFAQDASAGKAGYTLFNPTPARLMRDMSTDRPDQTEGPFTVDAGHFQIETDIAKYTYNTYKKDGENTRSKTWNIAPVNFRAGLTNSIDMHVLFDTYLHQTSRDRVAGTKEKVDGSGDLTIRLKKNLWGNDGGKTAFALLPYVKIPANQNNLGNNDVEGGLIAPLAIDLGGGYGLGLMTRIDILKDADDDGYHPSFANSATFGMEVTDSIGSYLEIYTEKGIDSGDRWVVSLDTGVTYGLTDRIQLDAGVNIGLTEAADDYNPFIGIAYRY